MTRPLVHFVHANGFPSACYEELFTALGDDIDIVTLPMLGHDPAYAIAPNWHGLAEQVADSVRRQADGRPVIGLGHSLGGMASFMAAQRYPDLFQGLVMMDPAYINPLAALGAGLYKLAGRIDDITPAGRSKGRRAHWPDRAEAHRTLRSKGLFKPFTDLSFDNYLRHGMVDTADGVRLAFDPAVEVEIFRNTPSDTWRYQRRLGIPRALITGETSEFLKRGTMHKLAAAQRIPLLQTPGGHMFPFEQPALTAALAREHILRMHQGEAT